MFADPYRRHSEPIAPRRSSSPMHLEFSRFKSSNRERSLRPMTSAPSAWDHPVATDERDYAVWAQNHPPTEERLRVLRSRLATLGNRPLISVVVPVHDPEPPHLVAALASVEAQVYPEWELCIVDDASSNSLIRTFLNEYAADRPRVRCLRLDRSAHIAGATNAAIGQASGEFVAFLDHDDELTPDALLEVATIAAGDPTIDIVYSDHDLLDESGRLRAPCFKPDWSPELLLSYMYFGHLKVYRTSVVREVGGLRDGFEGSADYDLALRMVERAGTIRHVPKILYHWRAAPRSMALSSATKPQSFESGRRAVAEALRRRRITATAEQPAFAQQARIGVYRLEFSGTEEVPVTIIIPTKNKLGLLRNCIDSIEHKTTHRAYQILIVDNDSREPETRAYLSACPHRVLRYENGGIFNFAAMINLGVAQADTEHFVLLNNDTVVIAPQWLDELLGYGTMPGVGAVGSKLLYADGRLQHAGVLLGTHGLTGHAFQARPDTPEPSEYLYYAHVARNYLAVTAACLLSHKSAFHAVGGFNQHDLKVAWNDVDYCLRLREGGYRVVFNPYSVLYHLESQSRGDDKNPAEIQYMMAHWRHYIDGDPYYNLNLSRSNSDFRIKTDPQEERNFFYREYR